MMRGRLGRHQVRFKVIQNKGGQPLGCGQDYCHWVLASSLSSELLLFYYTKVLREICA